jgi:hypothetical protein
MGSSGVLTDLTNALIIKNHNYLMGTIASAPALILSDGANLTYCCDVNVSNYDSSGRVNQYKREILGIPGSWGYQTADSTTYGTILRNVPLATNNNNLIYADIGTAVIVQRSQSGQWQVTGFAEEQAGTYTMTPVDLGTMTIGPTQDFTVSTRLLTLSELAIYGGGFGVIPLGASARFIGGVFQGLN